MPITFKPIPIPVLPSPAPAAENPLPVPYIHQKLGDWCWAACAAMILQGYQEKVDQCDVATFVLKADCCGSSDQCANSCNYQEITKIFAHWNVVTNPPIVAPAQPALPVILIGEIQAGRPVQLEFAPPLYTPGPGHMVVVYGYVSNTSFWVHDPNQLGSGPVDYDSLLDGMGLGRWVVTWLGIQLENSAEREIFDGDQSSADRCGS